MAHKRDGAFFNRRLRGIAPRESGNVVEEAWARAGWGNSPFIIHTLVALVDSPGRVAIYKVKNLQWGFSLVVYCCGLLQLPHISTPSLSYC